VMVGMDARTGVERWRRPSSVAVDGAVEPRPLSAPFVHDNRVYAIFEEGLIGWDVASGRQAFEFIGNFPPATTIDAGARGWRGVLHANLEQPKTQGNRQGSCTRSTSRPRGTVEASRKPRAALRQ